MFKFTIDKQKTKEFINTKNMDKPLREWGLLMVSKTQDRMKKAPPTNILVPAWIGIKIDKKKPNPPNQQDYSKADKKNNIRGKITKPPLVNSGRLRQSISSKVNNDSVSVGTNVEYAEIMQTGGKNPISQAQRDVWKSRYGLLVKTDSINVMPRPYLFINAEDITDVEFLITAHIIKGIK